MRFLNLSYLYMADKLQALMGGNSMIKGVLSDPKQMNLCSYFAEINTMRSSGRHPEGI